MPDAGHFALEEEAEEVAAAAAVTEPASATATK
jgi:hypothetical protein